MKILIIMTMLIVVSSCGKNGSSSSDGVEEQNGYVEVTPVGSTGADLMNVTVDLPVEVTPDRIQFARGVNLADHSGSNSCLFQVNAGEFWNYHLSGNQLIIDKSNGSSLKFTRINSGSIDAHGIWAWSGHSDGMKIIRRLSLLDGRFILSQNCEG